MDLQILVYLIPFCVQNKNLYPKSSRNCVLLRAGLTKAGQSSPSAQMGRIGRPCLARPSKGHNFWNFLGINCCYTYKKVSKNPKIGGPLIIEYLESKLTKGGHFPINVQQGENPQNCIVLEKTLYFCSFFLAFTFSLYIC